MFRIKDRKMLKADRLKTVESNLAVEIEKAERLEQGLSKKQFNDLKTQTVNELYHLLFLIQDYVS